MNSWLTSKTGGNTKNKVVSVARMPALSSSLEVLELTTAFVFHLPHPDVCLPRCSQPPSRVSRRGQRQTEASAATSACVQPSGCPGSFCIRGLGLSMAAWILSWPSRDKGPQLLDMLLAQARPQAIFISGPRWLRSGNANIVSKEQLRIPVEASMGSQPSSREGSARSV